MKIIGALSAALVLAGPVLAAEPPPGLKPALEAVVSRDGAPGVTAMVFRDGALLYRMDVGAIAPDARLPIASASKWMTSALIMTLVDEGKLSLDEPIGKRLPELSGPSAAITLRQLLSYTSGQGSLAGMVDINQDLRMPLAEGARAIAARPLEDPPGEVFKYGSGAFQIAGALAEQASGKSWVQLFDERLGRPLGLTRTSWGNPLKPELPAAEVRNPNLQAGVFTTADDYARFLHMIAQRGVYQGRRILSEKAIRTMETDQTPKARMVYIPGGMAPGAHYALGHWCEARTPDGTCTMVSSPGAFGVYPWIDRTSGLYGVFFLRHRLPAVADGLRAARAEILKPTAAP
ncbi:serine hydrolase domain-containing protein [Phenylobacterium sp.]|jgi:CubicO group peptidase (beta-lactamase class C family)|uniref:serine hydrolase domain-containing protein n=1 Tax=Phenylobacterium sp. TaxID=1871053 RepID=UPI0037CAD05E